MLRLALISATLLLGSSGCMRVEPRPEFYLGRIGHVLFRVPAKFVMVSVKYEGEDDWSPPHKPPAQRTLADPISSIEFFFSRDQPGQPQDPDHAFAEQSRLQFSGPGTNHGWFATTPSPIPHGITMLKIDKNWHDPTMAVWSRQPAIYGLAVNRSIGSKYMPTWDTKYLNVEVETIIICSKVRMVVDPFTDISTCQMYVIN